MPTFFDKFLRYTKPYTRERIAKEKDSYGHLSEVLRSTATIYGIKTSKSVASGSVSDGKAEIGYYKTADVLYIGPTEDVEQGDFIIDGDSRYEVRHIESQDDFKTKNSHRIAYIQRIS